MDVITHSTAAALLEALSPDRWTDACRWESPWVFRGQQSADWALTPSAWRPQNRPIMDFKARYRTRTAHLMPRPDSDLEEASAQWYAEACVVTQFVRLADQLGFQVPGGNIYLPPNSEEFFPSINHTSPADTPHYFPGPAIALAQHHGIPTRLLDWTADGIKAAFFAASQLQSNSATELLAVWAIRPDLLTTARGRTNKPATAEFEPLLVAHGENLYLRSQAGLFLHAPKFFDHRRLEGKFPELEDFALAAEAALGERVIVKHCLPHSEAGELLRLLCLRNITTAHLMPTLDNIISTLKTKWQWTMP